MKEYKNNPVKITPPVLIGLSDSQLTFAEIVGKEDSVAELFFDRQVVEGIETGSFALNNCKLRNVVFADCKFKNMQLTDVRFENCDLSNVSFAGSSFFRVEFVACKLVGTDLSSSTFNHVSVTNCSALYCNCFMGKMRHVLFADSDFRNGSFADCKFTDVGFETCNLTEAEFLHTSLHGIDLSSSKISAMRLSIPDLKGVLVNSQQALELTSFLGIVVNDI